MVAAGSDNVPSALSTVTAYFWDEEGHQVWEGQSTRLLGTKTWIF